MIKKTTKILTSILVFSLLIFFNSVKIEAVENPEFEVYFMVNDKREFTKDNLDLLVDPEYNEVALELYIRAIGEERTLTTLQLELVENNLLKSITFTESAKVGRNNIWDMSSSSGGNAPSGPILALMGLGGQDVLIQTTPTYMATIYFEYNNLGDSDLLIDFNFTDAGRDGGFKTLDKSCFIINPIIVGDPNSTHDASLSSLDITGNKTNQTYDFNVDAEEIDGIIKNQIMISYQDSINGLTINPIFNKSSLGSSNYTIEESRLDGNNYYNGDTIKIITTDGDDSKTYMIEVFVEEPAIETGINLSLQAGDSGTISFNNDLKRYEIVTPFIETDIKVLASTIDPNATLNQTELSIIGLKQEEWTKLGVFIVTAEDGTTYKEYPVFAMRQKGSSNANIKIETNEYPNGIEPEGNNFIFNYDENKQSISFRIIKEHIAQSIRVREVGSNYTNYTEGLITKNQIQTGTTYSYEILVTPESGFEDEIVKYQVDFIIAKSSDTSLKTGSIKVKEDGFDEIVIDNNNLLYIISDNDSEHVTISIETDRNRQIKFGDGSYQDIQATHQIDVASLNYGNNNIYFTIKAEDGTTEQYYINIKKLSDQAEIESLVFRTDDGQIIANKDNFNYISSENKYVYRFDYGVYSNPSTLKLDVTTSQFSTISGRNSNNAVYTLDFSGVSELTRTQNIDIIAENGTTKNFTIQIVRNEADSNNEVVEINIGGIPFSQFKSGDIDVVYDKVIIDPLDTSDTLNFEIRIPSTSKATVKIGDRTFNRNESGRYNTGIGFTIGKEQVVKIVVTAQNGQTNTLTIPFIVATNNTKLSNIELLGTNFVFDPNVLESTINVNYSFGENITINAKAEHSSSKVFIDSVERETYSKVLGTNKTTVRVWVLSQAGIKGEEYVITINRNPALTNNDLDSFILKSRKGEIIDIGFLSSQTSYSIRIDDNDKLWPITYSASLDPAHNSYLNNNKNLKTLTDVEFNSNSGVTGQIIVDVYSEGGIKKTYTINVLKANDIKDFESVTISGIGFTTQTFTKDQFINNVLDLGSISYNVSQLNVSFNMISGSNSTIEASFIKNATSGIWDLNQTGSNEELFRVKSQAGNYSEYFAIKVNREVAKSENKLKELEVEVNGENILSDFNPKTNRYDLRVDRNISEVNILATLAKDDRSKVNSSFNLINEDTLNKYYSHTLVLRNHIDYASTEFKLEVEAEDGSINTYYITIWRRNVEIAIEEIQILNGSLVIYEGTVDNVPYLGEFDYSVNNLTIIITPKDKYTRISLLGKTAQTANEYGVVTLNPELTVGDNIITIRVQSDLKESEYSKDAVSQIIELEYRKNAASNVAELESLEVIVNGINLLKDIFSSDKLSYSGDYLRVDRTFENVRINAKAKNNGLVTASNLGTKFLNAGQTNIFIITVESESKQNSTEYKVEIVSKK